MEPEGRGDTENLHLESMSDSQSYNLREEWNFCKEKELTVADRFFNNCDKWIYLFLHESIYQLVSKNYIIYLPQNGQMP